MALEKLGPYEFLGIVGRGGMGSVYRGRHVETGEIHAVKVLAQNFTDDEHFRNRFESEIRALIKLDHPNIVRILSFGQDMGNLFFAMEMIEGQSLFQLQKKGHRFDWREILEIGKQVATGLRHAHDRGIIHRDLKPGNLMLPIDADGNQGEVKITDFGIAKRFGDSQNTGANVLGTMDFMSPEQAKGQPVTNRSDLYSLGTVMYTLLAGKPPFSANSVEESLRNLTRVPAPNIGSVVPGIPKEIDKLIQKLMEKRSESRIPTAQALLYRIEEVEGRLKKSSQAETRESGPAKIDGETFDVLNPGDVATQFNTGRNRKKPSRVATSSSDAPTVDSVDENPEPESSGSRRKVDYFNTVTDHIRQQQERELLNESTARRRGFWPVLVALLAIFCVAGFGIYRAYQPRSASELLAEIEAYPSEPQKVLDELQEFLKFYPDDSRASEFEKRLEAGNQIAFYNRLTHSLTVKRNLARKEPLSLIEQRFIDAVDLSNKANEKQAAAAKMAAFVAIYDGTELSADDKKYVQAARSFPLKLEYESRANTLAKLKQLRADMEAMANVTEPKIACSNYQWIIDHYPEEAWDDSKDGAEGRELVREAERLQKEHQSKLGSETKLIETEPGLK